MNAREKPHLLRLIVVRTFAVERLNPMALTFGSASFETVRDGVSKKEGDSLNQIATCETFNCL